VTTNESTKASRANGWRNLLAACVCVAGLFALGRFGGAYVPRFSAWVDSLGFWAPLVFIAGYVIATILFIPGSLLTLAAGATFGVLEGTLYVLAGATLGACAAFLVSRYLARDFVAHRLENERFAAVDRAVAREGRTIVFLLRLSPVFPFNLLNYALGLTNVDFKDYAIGCAGMLPGTLLYVYYGKLAGDVAAAAGGAAPQRGVAGYAVLVLGLLATIAVTTIITKAARKALREHVAGL
jgi:uncharacterized membrane protein YdjX (TVP38/TMEM64 family)